MDWALSPVASPADQHREATKYDRTAMSATISHPRRRFSADQNGSRAFNDCIRRADAS